MKKKLLFFTNPKISSDFTTTISLILSQSYTLNNIYTNDFTKDKILQSMAKSEIFYFFCLDVKNFTIKFGTRLESDFLNYNCYEFSEFKTNKKYDWRQNFCYYSIFRNFNEQQKLFFEDFFSIKLDAVDLKNVEFLLEVQKGKITFLEVENRENIFEVKIELIEEFFNEKKILLTQNEQKDIVNEEKNLYIDEFENLKGKIHVENIDLKGLRLKKSLFKKK